MLARYSASINARYYSVTNWLIKQFLTSGESIIVRWWLIHSFLCAQNVPSVVILTPGHFMWDYYSCSYFCCRTQLETLTVPFILKKPLGLQKCFICFTHTITTFRIYKSFHVNYNALTGKLTCKQKSLLQSICMVSVYSCNLYHIQIFHLYLCVYCVCKISCTAFGRAHTSTEFLQICNNILK